MPKGNEHGDLVGDIGTATTDYTLAVPSRISSTIIVHQTVTSLDPGDAEHHQSGPWTHMS